MSSLCNNKR